jgi:hypothetical protein
MDFQKEKRMKNGLYQCILGRRTDLCTCPDSYGENKNASGQDHGFTRMSWGGAWRIADLSAIHRVRGSRCKCAAARLWKYTLEAVDENGFIGIFMGGFKASAVGISAALIFSYIASIIFQPKMKK